MPFWAWIFFIIVISYGAVVLWRAWTKRYVKFGPVHYTAESDFGYFLFLVAVFAVSEIVALGFFVLVLISVIWGPVFGGAR